MSHVTTSHNANTQCAQYESFHAHSNVRPVKSRSGSKALAFIGLAAIVLAGAPSLAAQSPGRAGFSGGGHGAASEGKATRASGGGDSRDRSVSHERHDDGPAFRESTGQRRENHAGRREHGQRNGPAHRQTGGRVYVPAPVIRIEYVHDVIPAHFETVERQVWVPAVTRVVTETVWVPGRFEDRAVIECVCGVQISVTRRVWVSGHYDRRNREIEIAQGYFKTIREQVWVPEKTVVRQVEVCR